MKKNKEQINERLKLYDDTIHFRPTKRTPYTSWDFSWKAIDSDLNVTIEEAISDYALQEKIIIEFLDRYNFDSIYSLALAYNARVNKVLGANSSFTFKGNSINAVDRIVFDDVEDMRAFINNPAMYKWLNMGEDYYPDLTFGDILDCLKYQNEFGVYYLKAGEIQKEYGLPRLNDNTKLFQHNIEAYMSQYRGIKNTGIDMRRRPEMVKEFIQKWSSGLMTAPLERALSTPKDEDVIFDANTALLAHSILSTKQFAEFYWPELKDSLDRLYNKNLNCYMLCEAEIIRFADFFNDYPKGMLCIHPEIEDVREVRKAMPNIAIEGGMPVDLLNKGTAEKCKNFTKELIDTMGEGYIFSMNKMMNYPTDGNRQNLLAVEKVILDTRA